MACASNRATVADQRPDPLHKLGPGPIHEHQTVWIEHLNIAGMARNRKLARSMADAGWRLLRTILASKTRMDAPTVQVVSHWEPTSRTCPECGDRIGKLQLSGRQWLCPDCCTEHDRDANAPQTTLAAGVAARVNACGAESRSGLPASGRDAGNPS